jgi:hypothetical protein
MVDNVKSIFEKARQAQDNVIGDDPLPLGYTRDNRFAFILPKTKQLIVASASQLTSSQYLMGIAPLDHWENMYPSKTAAFSAFAAGDELMQQCRKAGPFNTANIRGRGIWRDGDEIVVNLGGPVPSPLYLCFEPIKLDEDTEFDAKKLLETIELFRWKDQKDATLFLGAMSVSPICGALNWRPHVWVHAPKGSGKTTLKTIFKQTCSPLVMFCDGGSSEAGIRQSLGPDSIAVGMDEFEGDQHAVKGVLRLARTASSADDPLLRGSPEGRAMLFALRTMFVWFSINPLGQSTADESRTVMLELGKHNESSETAGKIDRAVVALRKVSGRWCSYMVARAKRVLDTIDRFESILTGERRHRQNMATLLGGAYVALNSKLPSEAEAREWLKPFLETVTAHAEEQERDDGQECLDYLLSHTIRWHQQPDYPLRHWIAAAHERGWPNGKAVVAAHDMTINNEYLLIKNGSAAVDRVFAGSRWADRGWQRAIRKLDGVKPTDKTVKINKLATRATMVPLSFIGSMCSEGNAEDEDR